MRSRYGSNTAFLDMTLNVMMGISALFIISFLLIRQDNKKVDLPEPPVQMLVTMTWPTEGAASATDLDLWISWGNNQDQAVGFRSPVREGIALERDDLGNRGGDAYISKGKNKKEVIPINQEVIAMRHIPQDEITINAMYYFNKDKSVPTPCTVQVVKLNPYVVIYEGVHTLTQRGDEHTFIRFTMNDEGELIDKNFRQKSIVYARPADTTYNTWPEGSGAGIGNPAPRDPYGGL